MKNLVSKLNKNIWKHLKAMLTTGYIGAYSHRTKFLAVFLFVNLASSAVAAAPATPIKATNERIYDMTSVQDNSPRSSFETMEVVATAYSSTPDQTDDTPFITAANTRVRDGIVAANFLPMFTKIQIPELYGDKIFTVEDRMNIRYTENNLDVWFSDRVDAKEFGVKKITIKVL